MILARLRTASAVCLGLVLAGCGSQVVPAGPPAAIVSSPEPSPVEPTAVATRPNATDDLQNLPRVPASSLLPISQPREATYHRVRAGETLSSIARRYGVPLERLLDMNGIDANDPIQPDQLIYIPERP